MVSYGYWDKNGDFVDAQAHINNLVLLDPPKSKRRWLCDKGHTMHAFPISLDEKFTHWECPCKKITVEQRDQTFKEVIERTKRDYQLKTLEYPNKNGGFTIESSVFVGQDRIDAKRKKIGHTEWKEITDNILFELKHRFGISIDTIKEYFQE
jgi:hypothetical protein